MKKLALTLLLTLGCLPLFSQTDYIQVSPRSRYYFKIRNLSKVSLVVSLDQNAEKLQGNPDYEFILKPGGYAIAKKRMVSDPFFMQVDYPQTFYTSELEFILTELNKYNPKNQFRKEIHNELQKLNLKTSKGRETWETARNAASLYLGNLYFKEKLERRISFLTGRRRYIREIHQAASGENRASFNRNFRVIDIHEYTESRESLTNKFSLDVSIPISKSRFGDHWGQYGSLKSFGFNFAARLGPEISWNSGASVLSAFYISLDYQVHAHDLATDNQYYISSSYIKDPSQDWYELSSNEGVSLRFRSLSILPYIRTVFYPKHFFDIGFGWSPYQTGVLRFYSVDEMTNRGFVDPRADFKNLYIRNIAKIEGRNHNKMIILGLGRFLSFNDLGEPIQGLSIALRSSLYWKNYTPNDKYKFYFDPTGGSSFDEANLEKVPIENNDRLRFAFNLVASIVL